MSQIAATIVNVAAVAPLWGQADMEANPMPDPSIVKTIVTEAATTVPARTAGHETAEIDDSLERPKPVPLGGLVPSRLTIAIVYPSV
jgi:hypothetical protein